MHLPVGATGIIECVCVSALPGCHESWSSVRGGGLFVAAGGVDAKVQLYLVDGQASDSTPGGHIPRLRHAIALTGHQDWIRSIDISGPGMNRYACGAG